MGTELYVSDLADTLTAAVDACGMAFSGVDVRRRPDGSSVVLECNPSPMFAAIERRTSTSSVTEALGRLLIRSACVSLGA